MWMLVVHGWAVTLALSDMPTGSIAVMGAGKCEDPAMLETVRSFREEIIKLPGPPVLVQPEADTVAALGGHSEQSQDELRALYEDARQAAEHGRFEEAASWLRSGIVQVNRLPATHTRWELKRDLLFLAARAESASGRQVTARELVYQLVKADEAFEPPHDASSDLVKLFMEVRSDLESRPRGRLTVRIRGGRRDVMIYVDGRDVSRAPVLELPLRQGFYDVEADFDGKRGLVLHNVEVKPDDLSEKELDEGLEGSLRVDAGPCIDLRGHQSVDGVVEFLSELARDRLTAPQMAGRLGVYRLVLVQPGTPFVATSIDPVQRAVVWKGYQQTDTPASGLADFVARGNEDPGLVDAITGGMDAVAANERGLSLADQRKWPEAIAYFRRAHHLNRDKPEYTFQVGRSLLEGAKQSGDAKDLETAIAWLIIATKMEPVYPEPYYQLGMAYREKGKFLDSLAAFERYVKLRPDDPEGYYQLGLSASVVDDSKKALASYNEFMKRAPDRDLRKAEAAYEIAELNWQILLDSPGAPISLRYPGGVAKNSATLVGLEFGATELVTLTVLQGAGPLNFGVQLAGLTRDELFNAEASGFKAVLVARFNLGRERPRNGSRMMGSSGFQLEEGFFFNASSAFERPLVGATLVPSFQAGAEVNYPLPFMPFSPDFFEHFTATLAVGFPISYVVTTGSWFVRGRLDLGLDWLIRDGVAFTMNVRVMAGGIGFQAGFVTSPPTHKT